VQPASDVLSMAADSPTSGEMRNAFRQADDHSKPDSLFPDMSSNSLVREEPPYPEHRKASAQDDTSVLCRLRGNLVMAQLFLDSQSEQQEVGSIPEATNPSAASTEGGSKDTIVSL